MRSCFEEAEEKRGGGTNYHGDRNRVGTLEDAFCGVLTFFSGAAGDQRGVKLRALTKEGRNLAVVLKEAHFFFFSFFYLNALCLFVVARS